MAHAQRNRNTLFIVLFVGAVAVSFVGALLYFAFAFGLGTSAIPVGDSIAVVDVIGEIYYDRNMLKEIESYGEDDDIKALLVYVNSPGGGVAASQALYHAVRKVREQKPVVVSMGSVAASGGYYLACAADSIVAEEGTLTGSIGVIAAFMRTEELYQKIGLDVTVIKSGRYKDVGSPHREMTADERRYMADILDSAYEQFLEAVTDGRGIPIERVRELAEGRLYTGRQAMEAGLVDRMGSYTDAVDLAAEMAGIDGDPRVVKRIPRRSLWDRVFGSSLSEMARNRQERVALRYIIP